MKHADISALVAEMREASIPAKLRKAAELWDVSDSHVAFAIVAMAYAEMQASPLYRPKRDLTRTTHGKAGGPELAAVPDSVESPKCNHLRCAKPTGDLHDCPYQHEINDNNKPDHCRCCADCRAECVADI